MMASLIAGVVAALMVAQAAPALNPNVVQAIGPKQDDPRAICGPDGTALENGVEAIGPKQDDPRARALGAYNPETDPHANGGTEAIGPKQDDPRKGIIVQGGRTLEIGPKQDDPRSPQLAAGSYNPETDPHALTAGRKCKKKN